MILTAASQTASAKKEALMSDLTDYAENEILDHLLGTGAFTSPTNVYLGLCTTAPSDSTGGTEVSGNGYARQAVAFGAASSGSADNSGTISFTASGGNWGDITHWELWDALTTGNRLMHGALTSSRTINDGDTLEFAAGDITMTAA